MALFATSLSSLSGWSIRAVSEGHKFDSCRGIRFCFLSYARESMNITSFSCLWLIVTQRSDTIRLCHLKRFFCCLVTFIIYHTWRRHSNESIRTRNKCHETDSKCRKTRVSKSQLALILLLIG